MGGDGGTPVCTVIGGPNGSGKSTIYEELAIPGRFVNADVIARGLAPDNPESASLLAGRQTLEELNRVIERRESFVYETTLSSGQSTRLMLAAKAAGYEVGLVFVALRGADLNVKRVAERVARGGHHIEEHIIRRRYEKAFARLAEAIRVADDSVLYDNSSISGPHRLLKVRAKSIALNALDPAHDLHRRLAMAVSEALVIPLASVFEAGRR